MKWNKKFLDMVALVASWSRDPSTKVGAVIVDRMNNVRSVGYNGFPRNVDDNRADRWNDRPTKYKFAEHAERNAIFAAARHGTPIEGCKMYLGWYPCADCARAIIQVGIKQVVIDGRKYDPESSSARDERWAEDFRIAKEMFDEAEVNVYIVPKGDLE
jgi:dCMP deaminase